MRRYLLPTLTLAVIAAAQQARHVDDATLHAFAANKEKPMLKDRYVNVNGVRLHYVTAGKGPLILFLHGFPEFWYEWKNQLVDFGKDHQAIAPDLRGYNLSDKPANLDQYKMAVLVEDIRALADHFSHQRKFVLVGHDWGGAVAWSFAMHIQAYSRVCYRRTLRSRQPASTC
jgi:epoxide hydrolase 4